MLVLLSMAAVIFFMVLDKGISGGSRTNPLFAYAVLACQAMVLIWLFRTRDDAAPVYAAELAAAAPFLIVLLYAWVR